MEGIRFDFLQGTGDGSVGGFWWSLHFNWLPVPQRIRSAQKSRVDPYPCVFNIALACFSARHLSIDFWYTGCLDRPPWPVVSSPRTENTSSKSVVMVGVLLMFFSSHLPLCPSRRRYGSKILTRVGTFVRNASLLSLGVGWWESGNLLSSLDVWWQSGVRALLSCRSYLSARPSLQHDWGQRYVSSVSDRSPTTHRCSGKGDVHGRNSMRLAEVWMDDYKRFYYLHRHDLKVSRRSLSVELHAILSFSQGKDFGDVESRREIRKRLNCKSFKWYLENVFPEKFILDENVHAYGEVSPSSAEKKAAILSRASLAQESHFTLVFGHLGSRWEGHHSVGGLLVSEWCLGQSIPVAVENGSIASRRYMCDEQWPFRRDDRQSVALRLHGQEPEMDSRESMSTDRSFSACWSRRILEWNDRSSSQ